MLIKNDSKWITGRLMGFRFSAKLNNEASNKAIDGGKILNLSICDKRGIEKLFYNEGDWLVVPKGKSKIVYYALKKLLPLMVIK